LFDTTPTQATSPILSINPFSNPSATLFDPSLALDSKQDMAHPHSDTQLAPLSPFPLLDSLPLGTAHPSALFDDQESSAFNSFLQKFGDDQHFLFNPELPPGMPSPPPSMMAYSGTQRGEDERRERDRLGVEVEGLNLESGGGWTSLASQRAARPPVEAPSGLLGFAQPPAPQMIKSEFGAPGAGEGPPPGARGDSKTRGRSLTDDLEQHGVNGRGNKLHKSTHDDVNSDIKMEETNLSDDEVGPTGTPGRRRTSRASGQGTAPSSRRRHSSSSRPTQPLLPAPTPAPQNRPRSDSSGSTGSASQGVKGERRAPLTEAEKRTNHILSEQRRRNQIKVGFASLVELIAAGEDVSGITVRDSAKVDESAAGGKKKGSNAGAGRGRGRKGDVGGGASKSVVLQKAARYVSWLEKGNDEIEAEVRRVEGLLSGM